MLNWNQTNESDATCWNFFVWRDWNRTWALKHCLKLV